MSEMVEHYKSQMPERCLQCPVFSGFVRAAEIDEAIATGTSEAMISLNEGESLGSDEIDDIFWAVHSTLLEVATDGELHSLKSLATLAQYGDECPAPKRGLSSDYTVSSKAVAWLTKHQTCQNPGLGEL